MLTEKEGFHQHAGFKILCKFDHIQIFKMVALIKNRMKHKIDLTSN
jgi:hypothetical protein